MQNLYLFSFSMTKHEKQESDISYGDDRYPMLN